MPQRSHHDHIILTKINKDFVVDSDNGFIYKSKLNINNDRVPIGHKSSTHSELMIGFSHDNRIYEYPISRLIYISRYLKIPDNYIVFHIDGNIYNNKISNLSTKENNRKYEHVRFWTEEEEIKFIEFYNLGLSHRKIADLLNRSVKAIRHKIAKSKVNRDIKRKLWTEKEDQELIRLYTQTDFNIGKIAELMNRTDSSIRIRANRYLNKYKTRTTVRDQLSLISFYTAFKSANQRGTLKSKCCLCDYSKYIELHHIDGNRKNNHVSNFATVCPNHHREIEAGEHKEKKLFAIWQRIHRDGTFGTLHRSDELSI